MPQVRCPQCGALNSTTDVDYPFCLGCQDNLAKCGYCSWFEAELGVCTNPEVAGFFDATGDSTPPCDQHKPRSSLLTSQRTIWPVLLIGLVAALVLVYAVIQFRQPMELLPQRPQDDLRMAVEADFRAAVVGQPYGVTAEIKNTADDTVGGIRLQISKESLRHFRLMRTEPRADAVEEMGEWRAYVYHDLRPHETRKIEIELIPKHAGSHHLAVRLVSRGAREYHGLADFPVSVAAASETVSDEKPARAETTVKEMSE